jgi:Rrf2 family protein
MKLITRNTDYAIGALLYLAKKKKNKVCASELVRELNIPEAFLRGLLQHLSKNSILESHKGKGGGFMLKVAPDKIRIADLVKIFQGSLEIVDCTFKKDICPNRSHCMLRSRIKEIEGRLVRQLESITIASLLKGKA